MDRRLFDRIRNCPSLPPLPAVAVQVLELTQGARFDMADVARVLLRDPSLAAKILQTVNSSFYGNHSRIGTLGQALVRIGLHGIRTLTVGLAVLEGASRLKISGFDRTVYWRRAVYSATAARLIGKRLGAADCETCFMAALLMDIGMLALDQVLQQEYATITAKVASHADLHAVEAQSLGHTHAEVAGVLARQWKFPDSLRIPMEFHDRPQEVDEAQSRVPTAVVALAGRCADVFVDDNPMWAIGDARRQAGELFGWTEAECDALLKNVGEQARELAPLFQVLMDPQATYEALSWRARQNLDNLSLSRRGETVPADERRRAPRVRKNCEMLILPCQGERVGRLQRVSLIDLSAGGIGLRCPESLKVGEQFVFKSKKPDGTPVTLLYRVIRQRSHASGGCRIGAQFVSALKQNSPAPQPGGASVQAA